jgi:hypothetical protein
MIKDPQKIYMHTVTMKVKPDDAESYCTSYMATTRLRDDEPENLGMLAARYGAQLEVETTEVDLIDVEAPVMVIGRDVEKTLREVLGINEAERVKGAEPDYNDARVNELERAVRNQNRTQAQMLSALDNIVNALARLGAPVAQQIAQPLRTDVPVGVLLHTPPPPAQDFPHALQTSSGRIVPLAPTGPLPAVEHVAHVSATDTAPRYVEHALTEAQSKAQSMQHPLIGTPSGYVGDASLPLNPNARAAGKTAEMASGQMDLAGRAATSHIFSFGGRTNDKGELVPDRHELPRVGDSLKSLASQSDIKIPGEQ